jgi:hypothetical protein
MLSYEKLSVIGNDMLRTGRAAANIEWLTILSSLLFSSISVGRNGLTAVDTIDVETISRNRECNFECEADDHTFLR